MKKYFLTLILLIILFMLIIFIKFGSALFQEKKTLPILYAIFKLELTKSEFVPYSQTDEAMKYVSANIGEARYDSIKNFMKEKGWSFREQLGSGLIFERNEQITIIETRQFTKDFILFIIPSVVQ